MLTLERNVARPFRIDDDLNEKMVSLARASTRRTTIVAVRAVPTGREIAMAAESDWVPPGTDTGKANIARVYDWWIGGTHNFRADQDAARALIAVEPNARAIARANRAFLGRAVRYLAAEA